MNWVCKFSANAEQDLRGLPKAIQTRVDRVLARMATDPFQGDVKALQGSEWTGVFRRRIGDYRLLFTAGQAQNTVVVQQISRRSGKTCR